jgi:hypothetical protein
MSRARARGATPSALPSLAALDWSACDRNE